MPHTNNLPPAYTPRDTQDAASASPTEAPRVTYTAYKQQTDIANQRRDNITKKIDKLVEDHLVAPHDNQVLHRLRSDAPKHLQRLQYFSPMRHALVTTQLNLIVQQAALYGATARTPAQHAQAGRDFSQRRSTSSEHNARSSSVSNIARHNNVVIVDGSGSGSGGGSGGGSGDGSGGS